MANARQLLQALLRAIKQSCADVQKHIKKAVARQDEQRSRQPSAVFPEQTRETAAASHSAAAAGAVGGGPDGMPGIFTPAFAEHNMARVA
eukprot:13550554-Alexandrium_andersonii.AAC.1